MTGFADCLAGFLDALGIADAHVMGVSFGGAVAIAFQHRHPTRVRSLVLASAYAGWRGSLPPEAAEARLAQALQLSQRSGDELVNALLPTMFDLPVSPEDYNAFRAAIEAFHPVGFRAMAQALAEDLRALLPSVNVPTLLICGDADLRAPITVAEQLSAAIPTSHLVVLKGAGHMCNVELPQLFNEAVRMFLLEQGS